MTNKFYNHDDPFTAGSTVRSDAANSKFDGITVGLDSVEVETKRSIKLPIGADIEITENAITRAGKALGFNSVTGDLEIQPGVGNYRGNYAAAQTYAIRDIFKDSGGVLGLNNLYITTTEFISTSLGADVANFATLVNVSDVEVAKVAAQAAQSAAETARTGAQTAQGLAETARTGAELAKTNAETAQTASELAATNASNSEANALSSANSASTSAGTATTQAGNATTQAGNANASANAASSSASAASTSASNANNSAIAAALSETNAGVSETNALASADTATTQAGLASSSASSSSASAGASNASAVAANNSAIAAATSYDTFDDRYLGAKSSAPTLDNDGQTLLVGAIYFDTVSDEMNVWTGLAWKKASASVIETVTQEYVYTASASQTVFTGVDDNANSLVMDTDQSVLVYLNGVKLIPIVDYIVDSIADSITLAVGATAGDLLLLTSFNYLATYTPPLIPSVVRNGTLNQEAVTQGESTRTGMSSTIYTGNGTTQSIATGVDMATGDFGGLVWVKDRSAVNSHRLYDTIRAPLNALYSDLTFAETVNAGGLTSFNSSGFSIGNNVAHNANTETYVAWSFQTNKKTTGLTNRNKAYTAHYNSDLGFSIIGYVGDGVDGHEIPHHLGVEPELSIVKSRDSVTNWYVHSSFFAPSEDLQLDSTLALLTGRTEFSSGSDSSVKVLGASTATNQAADNYISYHFTSKAGVSKVGKYIGTGAAGNYVDCGFKVGWVMIKNLTTSANGWFIEDSTRPDSYLVANSSGAEAGLVALEFVDGGFVLVNTSGGYNELNSEFLFLAFAETALDGTKQTTDYSYPTTADTLSIAQNTLISFANGFSASGQVDTQENVGAGVTYTLGVGFEDKHYWLYKDKAGAYGVTENRPLEGLTRNLADTYGVESPLDASLRTTAKHFDYESSTGVALASGELDADRAVYKLFNKQGNDNWIVSSATTSNVSYKSNESRILKSWRFKEQATVNRTPKRFTIEGSNDGLNWTAIDSTYTASDYVGNGSSLWGALQDTSANTTAYPYHRINITANNGDATFTAMAELEFNTVLPSDYYLINEGIQYNSAGTPIERTYLAELRTNADGDVATYRNLPVAKQRFNEVEVHGDLVVRGDIENPSVATAWASIDGTQNPPLLLDGVNVKDVIDLGLGFIYPVFETPMDNLGYTVGFGAPWDSFVGFGGSGITDKEGFSLITRTVASAAVDRPVTITVFGGKD